MSVVVAALYRFTRLDDYKELRPRLLDLCTDAGIKGTLLLAREGINGTVSGSREAIDALKAFLVNDGRFEGVEYKESCARDHPFHRMKVKLKKEIVTMGVPEADPTAVAGTYVNAQQWNELLSDPNVLVIDTRNDYEVMIGTFPGAINPKTKTFREFPEYVRKHFAGKKDKKIAMMCTGGIRCEKASSFMRLEGFDEVYHLKGGILQYLEDVSPEENKWQGECFVFDQRVALGEGLALSELEHCYGCRMPLYPQDKEHADYREGVHCHHCRHERSEDQHKRAAERHYQIKLAQQRNTSHIGQSRHG